MNTRRAIRSNWTLTALAVLFLASAILPAVGWSDRVVSAADRSPRAESVAKVAKSTASRNARDARFAHDGKASTTWSPVEDDRRGGAEERASTRRVPQSWLAFDLGERQEIAGVGWRLDKAGSGSATIQCSVDGKKWTTAAKLGRTPVGKWQRQDVRCDARHVRFLFGSSRSGSWSVSEVKVFAAAAPQVSTDRICQRVAVPAYFDDYWQEMTAAAPAVGLAVLNPNSGPDIDFQKDWLDRTKTAQNASTKITVVGYVRTKFDPNQGDTEDPNSEFRGRRAADLIKAEIDRYYEWYQVDGIFFDEFNSDASMIPYYRDLADYTRQTAELAGMAEKAVVVVNPGWVPEEEVMEFADVVVTFETDYSEYESVQFPAWTRQYRPERFMHVVYGLPGASAVEKVLDLVSERNVGHVYLSDVADPNRVFKSLGGGIWDEQIDAVKASCA